MLQYTILDSVKRPFIIYKDTFTNQYCLEPRRGKNKSRTCIITYPETCINVMRDILEKFDMYHVRVNYDLNTLHDYRFLSDEDQIKFSRKYDSYTFDINDTIKWITEGQFIDSRIKFNSDIHKLFKDSEYKVYLLKRNLRECIIEHASKKNTLRNDTRNCKHDKEYNIMNMYIKTPYYNEISEYVKIMIQWYESNTFETINYEDLTGLNGKTDQYNIILKLIEDHKVNSITIEQILNECINKQEQNKIKWEEYWNENIEKWFKNTGLYELNKKLGYEK
jgi:hypothetical protein